jgi:catechol 1,2-dioxygenase
VRHDDLPGGVFMTQMYFKGDPYLGDNDPGENALSSLEVSPVPHTDPEELKALGLEGYSSYLTQTFDIVVETATADELVR